MLQDVLTPVQEVWLDAGPVCPPWTANLWALGEVLAAQHGQPLVRESQPRGCPGFTPDDVCALASERQRSQSGIGRQQRYC